jgi:hypothetical protein
VKPIPLQRTKKEKNYRIALRHLLPALFWIRIGPGFDQVSGSGSRRAKMTHKVKKIEKSYEISCFDVLGVLFIGLKASPVAWTFFIKA